MRELSSTETATVSGGATETQAALASSVIGVTGAYLPGGGRIVIREDAPFCPIPPAKPPLAL